MSEDFRARVGVTTKKQEQKNRFTDIKILNGATTVTDLLTKNIDTMFDSLDIAVNNSNYTLDDLKKMYVVDFYRVLGKINKKLKDGRGNNKNSSR